MFARVFGQIFDSSIAEDYNCRRMFMDLLILADRTGAVDMTHEAIARRTNVPLEQVRRYIAELCQPDPTSRSKREEGKRLVPLDSQRDWGWQIVNYQHYRVLKDEEARRSYFRDAQRKYRRRRKRRVKDKGLTSFNAVEQNEDSRKHSVSDSISVSDKKGVPKGKTKASSLDEVKAYAKTQGIGDRDAAWFFDKCEGNGWTNGGRPIKDWRATLRSWKNGNYLPSQKVTKAGDRPRPKTPSEVEAEEAEDWWDKNHENKS